MYIILLSFVLSLKKEKILVNMCGTTSFDSTLHWVKPLEAKDEANNLVYSRVDRYYCAEYKRRICKCKEI